MNKRLWCAALLSLVVVVGTGCGQKPNESSQPTPTEQGASTTDNENQSTDPTNAAGSDQPGDSTTGSSTPPKTDNGSTTPVDKPKADKQLKIDVYYTDPQELELKKSQQDIKYQNDIQKYKEAYQALQNSNNKELVPLWAKIELKSIDFKDGAITMDIHMPDEARLGSGGEQYALDALTNTMFQFKEVNTLELLVDGKKVESLMGHVDLDHPLQRR